MRSSSNTLKNTFQKKKLSNNSASLSNHDSTSQMNKTSLSSLSTSSLKNEDKLLLLKEKLEKQRQIIKKTGRRFKDSAQIQVQTEQPQQTKHITTKMLYKSTKVSTGVGSSTNNTCSLYDFTSIKNQAQNRTKAMLMKRNPNPKSDLIVPVYTTQQILNSVNMQNLNNKSLNKASNPNQQSNKMITPTQLKRQTVNLMQLSSLIEKSPIKNTSKQKQTKIENQSQLTFLDPSKLKRSTNSENSQMMANSRVFETAIEEQKRRNKEVQYFLNQAGLQEFTQEFIRLGFDEVQTLIEVQIDDLNQMKMRAKQQDRLMNFIKEFKRNNRIQSNNNQSFPLIDRPSSIKSRLGFRPQFAKSAVLPSQRNPIQQHLRVRTSAGDQKLDDLSLVNKSSIFYIMGGNEWSLQSQIRKGCSGCFRVSYDAVKRGECYYCEDCDPGEMDELDISLDESMVRSYH